MTDLLCPRRRLFLKQNEVPNIKNRKNGFSNTKDICLFEGVSVYSSQGLFGLIADDFGTIIPPIYKEVIPAYKNHFWGRKNQKWKLYNFKNTEINSDELVVVTGRFSFLCNKGRNLP